jgi:hypothetical protein
MIGGMMIAYKNNGMATLHLFKQFGAVFYAFLRAVASHASIYKIVELIYNHNS